MQFLQAIAEAEILSDEASHFQEQSNVVQPFPRLLSLVEFKPWRGDFYAGVSICAQ